jgi:hypothetical protein
VGGKGRLANRWVSELVSGSGYAWMAADALDGCKFVQVCGWNEMR